MEAPVFHVKIRGPNYNRLSVIINMLSRQILRQSSKSGEQSEEIALAALENNAAVITNQSREDQPVVEL